MKGKSEGCIDEAKYQDAEVDCGTTRGSETLLVLLHCTKPSVCHIKAERRCDPGSVAATGTQLQGAITLNSHREIKTSV